jgi:sarcosine oxidase
VPLVKRACALWREAGETFGEPLLFVTGSLETGPEKRALFSGSLACCIEHDLQHEVLTATEAMSRYPVLHLPREHRVLIQPDGGFVASERAIVAHTMMAQAQGATIHAHERVLEWAPIAGGGVVVTTDRGCYEGGRLVLTAGAWIGDLVPSLKPVAIPERQVIGWFQPTEPSRFMPDTFPVTILDVEEGAHYVMPIWGAPGVKTGRHHHERESGEADTLSREANAGDEATIRSALARYLPEANGPLTGLRTCIYTNTPDEHFIIDTLPDAPEVIVASPCSGHGYTFASVVGEIVADLATKGSSAFDLSMFRVDRF